MRSCGIGIAGIHSIRVGGVLAEIDGVQVDEQPVNEQVNENESHLARCWRSKRS